MNTKEWKRNELFHLLMEKFGLNPKPLNEFKITGTGLADLVPTPWSQNRKRFGGEGTDEVPEPVIVTGEYEGPMTDPEVLDWEPEHKAFVQKQQGLVGDFESGLPDFSVFKQAISDKESKGVRDKDGNIIDQYKVRGIPVNAEGNPRSYYEKGEQARGKYQIMPTNWRAWSKAAGLPERFQDPDAPGALSPENQEKVADHQFRYYYNKYNVEGASPEEVWRKVAIAWYGGEGGVRKVERGEGRDLVYHKGTPNPFPSVSAYADDPKIGIMARMRNLKNI